MRTIEWQWFEHKLDTQLAADGGEEDVVPDGGETVDEMVDTDSGDADKTDA